MHLNNKNKMDFYQRCIGIHRSLTGTSISFVVVILLLFITPGMSWAQSGVITGTVIDGQTGQPLAGAGVSVEDGSRTVRTDRDGRYILRGVAAGQSNLLIEVPGYASGEVSVSLNPGDRLEHMIELDRAFGEGDSIFVFASQQEQSQALSMLQGSGHAASFITSEQMDRFGDYTIQDAVFRLPGVQAVGRNEINLRGAGLMQYRITVDGQRMATTGLGDRGVDLGMLDADLYRQLELIKVLRPDMDADAISGVINLRSYQPVGGDRSLGVSVGGGADSRYFDHTGAGSRASIRYSETITEELSLSVNVAYQQRYHSEEHLGMDYGTADFGQGPVDVIERVSPGLTHEGRNTTSGRLQLTYQPSSRATYHIRGLIHHDNRQINVHQNYWNANQNWVDASSTAEGSFNYNAGINDIGTQQYVFSGGARYLFNSFNLEYDLGWSRSRVDDEFLLFPFQINNLDYSVNVGDRTRPIISLTDMSSPESREMILQTVDHIAATQLDNTYMGKVDAEIPFQIGSFKIGSSARLKVNDVNDLGAYNHFKMNYRGFMNLGGFEKKDQGEDVLEQYHLPWLADIDGLRSFFDVNAPGMANDNEFRRRDSDYRNYRISENIFSGYGMVSIEAGRLTMEGGVRIEYTDTQNKGRLTEFNQFGRYEQTSDTSRSHSYTNLFPNAQLHYNLGGRTNFLLAYSRAISRPDFNRLSPFELVNRQDTTIFRGNPALKPMMADNIDFHADHYLHGLGLLSAGLFYKKLNHFTSLRQQTIQVESGDISGMDPMFGEEATVIAAEETMFHNSDESAEVYGVELAWRQNLTFLPGLLSNFGAMVNYTWTHSVFQTDRDEEVALPYQSPHVINAAVDYTHGRFFTQLSYHRTAGVLSSLGPRGLAPSSHGSDRVHLDRYQDGWSDLSMTFRFRISEQFRFWADASNLLRTQRILYQDSRQYYPVQIDYAPGRQFAAGIRYDF